MNVKNDYFIYNSHFSLSESMLNKNPAFSVYGLSNLFHRSTDNRYHLVIQEATHFKFFMEVIPGCIDSLWLSYTLNVKVVLNKII
jgi:hypothetical protein